MSRWEHFEARRETLSVSERPPIELQFRFRPASRHQDRIIAITKGSLGLFSEWFGPYPAQQLTIVDAPLSVAPHDERGASLLVVSSRLIVPNTDLGLERSIIAAVARGYFVSAGESADSPRWFEEGLARYAAARAINQLLDGAHFHTSRFFGGFVPYTTRALSLSRARRDPRPIFRAYEELDIATPSGDATQAAEALHTLERYIGWPAMQQALAQFVADSHTLPHPGSPEHLASIVRAQRGDDLGWFFRDVFRPAVTFDYAVTAFTTTARNDAGFETVVQVSRHGDALRSVAPFLHVTTRFADGTELRERWHGTDTEATFAYTSTSPAVATAIDPDTVLVLDANRMNNSRLRHTPFSTVAARLALNWMTWLQNLTLTYTSLV